MAHDATNCAKAKDHEQPQTGFRYARGEGHDAAVSRVRTRNSVHDQGLFARLREELDEPILYETSGGQSELLAIQRDRREVDITSHRHSDSGDAGCSKTLFREEEGKHLAEFAGSPDRARKLRQSRGANRYDRWKDSGADW